MHGYKPAANTVLLDQLDSKTQALPIPRNELRILPGGKELSMGSTGDARASSGRMDGVS